MRAHLLFQGRDFDWAADPAQIHENLLQDLDLGTLLDTMSGGDRFLLEVSRKVLLSPLCDRADIIHRQHVLSDCLAQPVLIREMYQTASAAAADKQGMWGYSWQRPSSTLAGGLRQLEAHIAPLRRLRDVADTHRFRSPGLNAFCEELRRELPDDYFDRMTEHLRRLAFRHGPLLSARLGADNGQVDLVLRKPARHNRSWRDRLQMRGRGSNSFRIDPRDDAGAQALEELVGRGSNQIANAVAQSADHISSYFALLRAELGFYVACLNLHDKLSARGAPITVPVPESGDQVRLRCSGLCDASLRLRSEAAVVGNDVSADDRPLVVITGANSGGKSTFLRSLGSAQLMMQCGMFVVAEEFRSSLASAVFTHFARDEDPTLTRGRLDCELARMSAIADHLRPGDLVLFNESFAATNEHEGSQIAGHVVRALLDSGVRVCFVTHQFEFAEGCRTHHADSALFLRADRRRDYKLIAAEPLPTSFGADLLARLGGWPDPAP